MITVKLNKSDFEYDIYSLVKAFFPSEDVAVSSEKKDVKQQVFLHIDVRYQRELITIKFLIPKQEKEMYSESDCISEEQEFKVMQVDQIQTDWANRSLTKDRLKQLLYNMFCAYTGRKLPWGTLTGIRPTKIPMKIFQEGGTRQQAYTYMKQHYYTSDEKIALSMDIAQRELELLNKLDYERGYSLYIGIPFCPSTCLYCSFTSYPVGIWKKRMDEYLDALEQELTFVAHRFAGHHLNTIYIGGGTPTSLEPQQLERLICKVKKSFDLSHLLEFTVEAGRPDSITKEKLTVLREQGISRISVNPQTMKQETLELIGRHHTVQQTIDSFYLARELGFDNINMDLIMGLPGEEIADARHTLEVIKALNPDNITVHSLAIKRAARLNQMKEVYQNYKMINTQEHMELTAAYMSQMGLEPYYLYRQKNMAGNFENVGYAKTGKAGIYNILIMEEKQSIVACGAGASTKRVWTEPNPDGTHRIKRGENVKDVASYISRIDEMIERKRQLFSDPRIPFTGH